MSEKHSSTGTVPSGVTDSSSKVLESYVLLAAFKRMSDDYPSIELVDPNRHKEETLELITNGGIHLLPGDDLIVCLDTTKYFTVYQVCFDASEGGISFFNVAKEYLATRQKNGKILLADNEG